jgi:hypothetical protein
MSRKARQRNPAPITITGLRRNFLLFVLVAFVFIATLPSKSKANPLTHFWYSLLKNCCAARRFLAGAFNIGPRDFVEQASRLLRVLIQARGLLVQ